jgi:hypothetical protein
MKPYGGVELKHHALLTLALDLNGQLYSPAALPPGNPLNPVTSAYERMV